MRQGDENIIIRWGFILRGFDRTCEIRGEQRQVIFLWTCICEKLKWQIGDTFRTSVHTPPIYASSGIRVRAVG